ncbi:MAG: hypothetical protein VCE43_15850 [Myxococcota bacterium]
MRTVLVTGSASGLGAALTSGLRDRGQRVIGLDIREADIVADLGTVDGRETAVAGVLDLCGGTLDGVVSCAGLGPYEQPEPIISVNYFGAIAMLDRFRDALAGGDAPAAVAISSVGEAFPQIVPDGVLEACHAGDEKRARELLAPTNGNTAYVSAKRALAQAAGVVPPNGANAGFDSTRWLPERWKPRCSTRCSPTKPAPLPSTECGSRWVARHPPPKSPRLSSTC